MKPFRKGSHLSLVLPLIVIGIFFSTCFCTPGQASVVYESVLQSSDCCACPANMAVCNLSEIRSDITALTGDGAFYQRAYVLDERTNVVQMLSDFSLINQLVRSSPTHTLFPCGAIPQDLFFRNESLRI